MDRRTILAVAGAALAAPRMLLAQPAKRLYRIATLDDTVESGRAQIWAAFRERLRELGYVDGKNVAYESRLARGATERLPALAAELVALKPDIIVTAGTPASIAATKATSSIPVVFLSAGDPIGTGLVSSLSRPGGNATGNAILSPEISVKSLELLHELLPGAKRLAFLSDSSNQSAVRLYPRLEKNAHDLKLSIQMLDGRERAALERSLATIKRERVQGVIVGITGILLEHRDQIVQFAAREKLPAVYGRREYVDAGGLLSYGADFRSVFAHGAEYVDRILKGAKPADLPVEQISSVRMVLNMKTARALGISIPAAVRVRADEVIE